MGLKKHIINFLVDVKYGNTITSIIRFFSGGLLFFSGSMKLYDPDSFGRLIALYDILPDIFIGYAAVVIPVLEILLGLLLIIGFKVRAAAFLSIVLMALFILFIGVNIIRGRTFDCGCFNVKRIGLNINETISWWLIFRDFIFLAIYLLLFRAERHLLSVENYREKMRLKNLQQSKYR